MTNAHAIKPYWLTEREWQERQERQQAETEEVSRQLLAIPASLMKMRAAKWLYDRRIPAGAITLLAGREGIGKSTISYDLVSRVTRGKLEGRYFGIPRGVGVVATEDAWAEVVLPRMVASQADLTRIFRVEVRNEVGSREEISVPADLQALGDVCERQDIGLLVLDPVMSVIHNSIDTHKDKEIRKALQPLADFCFRSGVAVLALIHVNKSSTTDPLNSIMASRGFTAVARSVLYCIADPESEKEDDFLFCHPKSNLGPKQPTLRYRLGEVKIDIDDPDDPVVVTSRVLWGETDTRTARDALEGPKKERATGELGQSIAEWVADEHRRTAQPVPAAKIADQFPHVKRATVDQNLKRLVERGLIGKAFHGHYTASDNVLTSTLVSEVSDPSEDLVNLTDLTKMTVPETSETLSDDLWSVPLEEPAVAW